MNIFRFKIKTIISIYRVESILIPAIKDYKKMDTLLQASAKLAKDKYLASKSSYEMLKEQKADLEKMNLQMR